MKKSFKNILHYLYDNQIQIFLLTFKNDYVLYIYSMHTIRGRGEEAQWLTRKIKNGT